MPADAGDIATYTGPGLPVAGGLMLDGGAVVARDFGMSEFSRLWLSGAEGSASTAALRGPASPATQSLWAYRCISAIHGSVGRVPIRLSAGPAAGTRRLWGLPRVRAGRHTARRIAAARGKGCENRAADGEILESGELHDLLDRPNRDQTQSQFLATTAGLLYARGRVHWLFDEMIGRRPVSMVVLDGADTKPIYDKHGRFRRLIGWMLTTPEHNEIPLALDEVITWNLFNPEDPAEGLSPATPARMAIVSDYNASMYNAAMFANNCEPGGIVQTDAPYDREADEQIRTSFRQRHGGAANARRLAVLWGGLQWQSVASTMQDMQFHDGKQMTREEICAAYGVPPSVAGFFGRSGDSSAYVDTELERFWQDTIAPLCDRIAEGVDVHIAPRFAQHVEAWADMEDVPLYQRLRRSAYASVKELWGMGVPLADAAGECNVYLPDRPQHDVGWLPTGVQPAAEAIAGPEPYDEGPGDDGATAEDAEDAEAAEGGEEEVADRAARDKEAALSDRLAARLWNAWMRSWQPLAKRFASMAANHYSAQERLVLRSLRASLGEDGKATAEDAEGAEVAEGRREGTKATAEDTGGAEVAEVGDGRGGKATAEGAGGAVVSTKTNPVVSRVLLDVFGQPAERAKFKTR
ncbi:MAG TPA: phage portal protein, partial [Phycisphaerae bacterium]|nr:phage portal protein [Phycisphaerae bacterium]